MVVVGSFSFVVIIDDVEDAAHPERIARVYQLVCPSIEASELSLPLRKPKHEARHIQILQSLQQSQGSDSAKGKTSMRFSSNHIRNASLVSLRQQHCLCNSLKDIPWQVESDCDKSDDIDGAEVAFSLLVHHELSSLLAFLEELVELLPIEQVIRLGTELKNG